MAGLSECFSHVAALLFYINCTSQKEEVCVTGKPSYWVHSRKKQKVSPKKLSNICLDTPSKIIGTNPINSQNRNTSIDIKKLPPSMKNETEFNQFLFDLKKTNPNSVAMYVSPLFQTDLKRNCGSQKRRAVTVANNVLQEIKNRKNAQMNISSICKRTQVPETFADDVLNFIDINNFFY